MDNLKVIDREIVPVYVTDTGEKVVYGSDLHSALGVSTPYRLWIDRRLEECDSTKDVDYQAVQICTSSGQSKKEHIIKLDTAKEMAMLERNDEGKKVRRHFIEIEKRYVESKRDVSMLDPRTQLMLSMAESIARTEMEQKHLAEQITAIKDIFTEEIADWKTEINKRVREISQKANIPYQELWSKLYADLEIKAHCSLSRLTENKAKRLEKAGNTRTTIKESTTKLAVIEDDAKRKSIFTTIVKEYAIKYCA